MLTFLHKPWYTECMEQYDVIILGGGPAGLSAAIYAARSGVRTAVAEALLPGGVAAVTPYIENYPGFGKISGAELAQKMHEHAESCGAEFVYGKAVRIQNGPVKKVTLDSGEELCCSALVLALGNEPRKLGIAGEAELTGAGVSYCATCDGNFFRGKRVAVAGGGSAALAAAEYLLPLAASVLRVHSGALPDLPGTEKIENAQITRLQGNPLQAVDIKTADGARTVPVDGLFVSLGYVPAAELVRHLVQTDEAGYIVCDERMQTDQEGIFAAGDARRKPLRQIVTAAADGAVAGQYAAVYAKKHRAAKKN